jgi:hypothetical protein
MLAQYARKGMVAVPYATLRANGTAEYHQPTRYPPWPLRDRLAFVDALELASTTLEASGRIRTKTEVTEQLLLDMDVLSRKYGATLVVVLLYGRPSQLARYASFLEAHGIQYVACAPRFPLHAHLRIPGETHPNGVVNAEWATCIAKTLRDRTIISSQPPA